ncbi:hypothetical protein D6D01_01937 [Aureobasidium pullulans]|uniref:Uncharacterized protein n=1 Tax=Aureobasidium pullulans TaxID=5580 RepID=A0A4S9LWT2_AURPU|nr:hypothetical protein D6D01_01937 [Aureobasidium pullulans]
MASVERCRVGIILRRTFDPRGFRKLLAVRTNLFLLLNRLHTSSSFKFPILLLNPNGTHLSEKPDPLWLRKLPRWKFLVVCGCECETLQGYLCEVLYQSKKKSITKSGHRVVHCGALEDI